VQCPGMTLHSVLIRQSFNRCENGFCMDEREQMDRFLQLYGTLPRAGPGSNELTRQAFHLIEDLPESPRILDVGCGPGMQTLELLRISSGSVVALDILSLMIDRVKADAHEAGLSHRLETIVQDMNSMTFQPDSFDLIWSEGAIYNLGFEAGLTSFKEFVKPGGYVAVSEVVWLKPDPPEKAIEFWQEYPEIDTVNAKLAIIERLGYEVVGHFLFPTSAWTEQYYDPLESRIAEKAQEWTGLPDAEAILQSASNEIELFRKYSDTYGYVFFVMRNL